MNGGSHGFTIIEVMIFLAITGILLLMVFIGTGMVASQRRLSDATDGLQAYLQSEYDKVVNGVNVRGTEVACSTDGGSAIRPGASNNCLLLGRLVVIKNTTTLESFDIISTQKLPDAYSGLGVADLTKLQNVGIAAYGSGSEQYELKWGAEVSNASRTGSPRPQVNAIAFVRIPDSSRIVQLYYYRASAPTDPTESLQWVLGPPAGDTGAYNPLSSGPSDPSLALCIQNDKDFIGVSPRTAVYFGQGQGAGIITSNYEPGVSPC